METGNRIDITDKDGWHKEFFCQKRLVYIGSDPRNDIILSPLRGTGVAARHLQLILPSGAGMPCSAVNLSQGPVPLGAGGERQLEPSSAMEISDGAMLRLGDFSLVIHLQSVNAPFAGEPAAREISSRPITAPNSASIGLRISLPQQVLGTDAPMEGVMVVTNLGNKPGVQFNLAVDGLPAECCEIGSAPILFPGAEKGVAFRLTHPRLSNYSAGPHTLCFIATAEEAYPGEGVTVSRDIRIAPFFNHSLRLLSID